MILRKEKTEHQEWKHDGYDPMATLRHGHLLQVPPQRADRRVQKEIRGWTSDSARANLLVSHQLHCPIYPPWCYSNPYPTILSMAQTVRFCFMYLFDRVFAYPSHCYLQRRGTCNVGPRVSLCGLESRWAGRQNPCHRYLGSRRSISGRRRRLLGYWIMEGWRCGSIYWSRWCCY